MKFIFLYDTTSRPITENATEPELVPVVMIKNRHDGGKETHRGYTDSLPMLTYRYNVAREMLSILQISRMSFVLSA